MYRIQYFSNFDKQWKDYSPVTHISKPVDYTFPTDAEAALVKVQKDHPRDRFAIIETAA